jgi:hypothetical protein
MRRTRCLTRLACLLALLTATAAPADPVKLDKTTTGAPAIKSIDVIRFGPGGVLFIGDGKGSQIIAVEVEGTSAKAGFAEPVEGVKAKIAGKLGATAKDVEIVDLAVHPVTHTAYVAVRKQQPQPQAVIMTVDGSGKIGELALDNVKYARLVLPSGKGALSKVTDVAWAGDRLLAAGLASEEFASKIFVLPAPLAHEAKANIYSTETFHVAHNKWETKAPMTVLMPYEEGGKKYLAGSFACTPVVKYPLDEIKEDNKVKGVSMIEMGNGNRPLNMFSYEKDGKSYVLMNTFRMHHARKAFGPSPYWTVKFERDLLAGKEKVNQEALWRIDRDYKPKTDRIKMVEEFHGVVHMDKLDDSRALTMKDDGKGNLNLVALPLP